MRQVKGYRRGALTVISSWKDGKTAADLSMLIYSLKCDCGKEFDIQSINWTKHIRDCGCGKGEDEMKITLSIKMDTATHEKVRQYANQNGMTKSAAVCMFVQLGILKMEE